mmetsp:Transcript_12814/g.40907  ORF Transcript_12814/g.40907 Transcript_12814/m.40907 type:complete len:215 (-) Transcript_12814:178-822(-)
MVSLTNQCGSSDSSSGVQSTEEPPDMSSSILPRIDLVTSDCATSLVVANLAQVSSKSHHFVLAAAMSEGLICASSWACSSRGARTWPRNDKLTVYWHKISAVALSPRTIWSMLAFKRSRQRLATCAAHAADTTNEPSAPSAPSGVEGGRSLGSTRWSRTGRAPPSWRAMANVLSMRLIVAAQILGTVSEKRKEIGRARGSASFPEVLLSSARLC